MEELNHTAALLNEAKEKLKLEKKERHAAKKLIKELAACKTMLEAMEVWYWIGMRLVTFVRLRKIFDFTATWGLMAIFITCKYETISHL